MNDQSQSQVPRTIDEARSVLRTLLDGIPADFFDNDDHDFHV